ncbi:TonB family protein [uncultured Sulfitobacter sp.]|uniref:cell envelope integrity protein TolA n=1 Tax=uncultured Sulfitobacter sp. TaxID=191468 RepID=UPI0030D72AE8|tara:strand:+ start:46845 stop:47735 length:891 start_codon:yes stop_codon:yes gene_type:complete
MIFRSHLAKGVSLVLATGIVAGAAQLSVPKTQIEMEGGGPQVEARMGSTFEDMAVGTLTALTAETAVEPPVEPVAVEPVKAQPVQAEPIATPAPTPMPELAPQVTPTPTVMAALTPVPAAPTRPVTALAPKPETIVAETPETQAPIESPRPKEKAPEVVKKKPEKKPVKQATARGNAKRNNTKGADTGTNKNAKATTTGNAQKAASQAGNAAVSNYPGQVMRRISRVGKPRVKSKGEAVIAFTIAANGGLGGVSIARSSGSSALDQAALTLIRKAAPFPKPPAGARRQYTIKIKGR